MSGLEFLHKIWRTRSQLQKDKEQTVLEIECQHKDLEIRYKAPCISHAIVGLLIRIMFHT